MVLPSISSLGCRGENDKIAARHYTEDGIDESPSHCATSWRTMDCPPGTNPGEGLFPIPHLVSPPPYPGVTGHARATPAPSKPKTFIFRERGFRNTSSAAPPPPPEPGRRLAPPALHADAAPRGTTALRSKWGASRGGGSGIFGFSGHIPARKSAPRAARPPPPAARPGRAEGADGTGGTWIQKKCVFWHVGRGITYDTKSCFWKFRNFRVLSRVGAKGPGNAGLRAAVRTTPGARSGRTNDTDGLWE
eukprot:gene8059-biopygen6098